MSLSNPPASKEYLTVKEAAEVVRLSRAYLDKMRLSGGGPRYFKVGGRVLYRRDVLEAWIEQREYERTKLWKEKYDPYSLIE
ncbi:hypothetical protein NAP1_04295 [Erythrobacter sp. NAP1]|uniref:helix-turn-helix transcriptional regulator n=1 Tax=Erythrobacter sp. NAP1 TaxID=237727 RepID=UPI0000686A09|nr:helix-turn-helix domain-containing protein [Erythrobacter sp. NAP1]EAQ29965.1 hypothetical protein NAP1_04295 [Erythrobacter sp. NAP1]